METKNANQNETDFQNSKFFEKNIITSDIFLKVITPPSIPIINLFWNVKYSIEPEFFDLRGKGAVILCRHQSNMDIVLENQFLYNTLRMYPYHFMKDSIPPIMKNILEGLHGYALIRPKDIKKSKGKYKRNDILEQTNYMYNHRIPYILSRNKIVILHPQGERQNGTINIKTGILERLLESQEVLNKKIPFAALNIAYGSNIFQRTARIEAKKPQYFNPGEAAKFEQYLLDSYKVQ